MNSNDDSSFASSSLFRITKQQSISKFHILARRARFGKTCKGAWWMPELISPSSSGSWPLFPLRTLRTGIGIENGTHNSKQVSQLSSVSKRLVLWESYESSFNLVILVFYVFFEAWLVLTLVFFWPSVRVHPEGRDRCAAFGALGGVLLHAARLCAIRASTNSRVAGSRQ